MQSKRPKGNGAKMKPIFHKKSSEIISLKTGLILIASCLCLGIFVSLTLLPAVRSKDTVSSHSGSSDKRTLSEKILSWLPNHHTYTPPKIEPMPDWSQLFWTPIDVDVSLSDPLVTLCKLNFKQYSSAPHLYPMFRDLETLSACRGANKKLERLSNLLKDIAAKAGTPEGRVIPPTGFVFHESRVGSTLVANELASDPFSMVFSESGPTANALLHCASCDRQKEVKLFRDIVTVMGRSPIHKRLFFKFQSITSTRMQIALEAFPNTSWAYVFRQPVQTMMSHLDPAKGSSGAPCLRSMKDPPQEVTSVLKTVSNSNLRSVSKEAWCAAHLNMLCSSAVEAYKLYGTRIGPDGVSIQRGLLINYESLPGIIPRVFLPMCGLTPSNSWIKKMSVESSFYSKGRAKEKTFEGDSLDKEQRSTQSIQQYAKSILEPSYIKMSGLFLEGLSSAAPDLHKIFEISVTSDAAAGDWSILSSFPKKTSVSKMIRGLSLGRTDWTTAHDSDSNPGIDANNSDPARAGGITVVNNLQLSGFADKVGKGKSADQEEEDDDDVEKSEESPAIGHSKFPEIPYQPWMPFSNTHNSKPFEISACPLVPDPGYPKTYHMTDITDNWNTDNTEIPANHYDSLCHFDYQNSTQLAQAFNYRKAEVPFVVYNVPEVDQVVNKWKDIDYIHKKLGSKLYRAESSDTNHFMYWTNASPKYLRGLTDGKKWKPPTKFIEESFESWLEKAIKGQNKTIETRQHEYFRATADMHKSWIFDELPFFQPKESLFIVKPNEQRGIHCRFGMRSVIAEAHFDGSRNVIALLGGLRRYMLTHPNQCVNMHMYPNGHPSGRHSAIDWSAPDPVKFPNWLKLVGNEVIMQPGDLLYLPTYWIHYIISLNVNYQCNTRSGHTDNYDADIHACGF